jgi:hypothetical protein
MLCAEALFFFYFQITVNYDEFFQVNKTEICFGEERRSLTSIQICTISMSGYMVIEHSPLYDSSL